MACLPRQCACRHHGRIGSRGRKLALAGRRRRHDRRGRRRGARRRPSGGRRGRDRSHRGCGLEGGAGGTVAPAQPVDGCLVHGVVDAHVAVPGEQGGQFGGSRVVEHGDSLPRFRPDASPRLTLGKLATYRTLERLQAGDRPMALDGPEKEPREAMECDVVVVGAGPAGLATAIRLKQLAAARGQRTLRRGARKGVRGRRAYPVRGGDRSDRPRQAHSRLEIQGRAHRHAGDARTASITWGLPAPCAFPTSSCRR